MNVRANCPNDYSWVGAAMEQAFKATWSTDGEIDGEVQEDCISQDVGTVCDQVRLH